ncbi:MAG TPA: FAD-dependent oxidoreductase [Roseiarcus sp.]|nr:FAD-dependent oxidoreductase [Roseiarcus sp.]
MKHPVVHVIGAGAAGLAAAQALVSSNLCDVVVHESKSHPGGRRRSFYDAALGIDVDAGNFPILSGWKSVLALIEAAGARGEWREEGEPGVAFADLTTGERWRLTPNAGRTPWWLLSSRRRGKPFRLADYWGARRLLSPSPTATVASCAPRGAAYDRLWRPLVLAALNCPPESASAKLAGSVLRELLKTGGAGMRLLTPIRHFGRAFIEPLTKRLMREGAALRFERKLVSIEAGPERVTGLEFAHDRIDLSPRDAVILATPWPVSASLVPGLSPSGDASAALTIHFAAPPPTKSEAVVGAVNGAFDWLFCYRDRISITINDAAAKIDSARDTLSAECWRGVAALTGLSDELPAWRVVLSRRASFLATPEEVRRRPSPCTNWRNLFLAGAYVGGPQPEGLEGSVRSGERAAKLWRDFCV